MTKIKRVTIAEAKALARDWEIEYERHTYNDAVSTRFRRSSASEVIKMWETGKNEDGRKLSQFEFTALCERWIELFGTLPPDDDTAQPNEAAPLPSCEPEPEDDTMLSMGEVVRLTGISSSTVKRMVLDGRFPKPMRLSPRRIGWKAAEVKAWIRQLDDQRRAPRQ